MKTPNIVKKAVEKVKEDRPALRHRCHRLENWAHVIAGGAIALGSHEIYAIAVAGIGAVVLLAILFGENGHV